MKTLTLFTTFVLILGITITSPLIHDVYAQDDPNVLLRIATQADQQISHQLDQIYDTIPSDIQNLYYQGHTSVESLHISLADNDIEQAREDFLNAMKSFKQITQMISEEEESFNVDSRLEKSVDDTTNRDLTSELNRLHKYFQNLKEISEKHNTGIHFSEIQQLFTQAYQQINSNEIGLANETIIQLESLIDAIKKNIHQHASHSEPDRVKTFAIKQLDKVKDTLRLLTQHNNSNYDDYILTQIDESYYLIYEIETAISQNDIPYAKENFVKLIKIVKIIEMSIDQ